MPEEQTIEEAPIVTHMFEKMLPAALIAYLDGNIALGTGEPPTTWQRLIADQRLVLRRPHSLFTGAALSGEAPMVEVTHLTNRNATYRFKITEAKYAALLELGVPETPLYRAQPLP
jgi:hypothetical protein